MKKIIFVFLIVLSVVLVSCGSKDFDYALKQMNNQDKVYGTSPFNTPAGLVNITTLQTNLNNLKTLELESGSEPFNLLMDFRIQELEANKFFMGDFLKYGSRGSTKKGFGCKGRPYVVNSTLLRNISALEGFKSVDIMFDMANRFPEESKKANITILNAVLLNKTYETVFNEARRDRKIIDNFCPQERVDELLRQEELKNKLIE